MVEPREVSGSGMETSGPASTENSARCAVALQFALVAPEIAVSRTRCQIEEAQLKQLQERGVKASPQERQAAKDQAEEQATKVAGMKPLSEPCLIVNDCTPERLAADFQSKVGGSRDSAPKLTFSS